MAAKKKRVRRRPEDARALILDAAEKSMAAHGPAGIRLQDVAKAAGVSHPTILHHFGSREGLVRALNLRTLEDLTRTVVERMAGARSGDDGIARTFAAYRGGLARRIVWSIQAEPPPAPGQTPLFDNVVQGLHALRRRLCTAGHRARYRRHPRRGASGDGGGAGRRADRGAAARRRGPRRTRPKRGVREMVFRPDHTVPALQGVRRR